MHFQTEKTSRLGTTSLHISWIWNNLVLFNFLIDNGAKLDIMDENGFMAIHYAIIKNNIEFLSNLHNRGINILQK